jgi:hypothetical protein
MKLLLPKLSNQGVMYVHDITTTAGQISNTEGTGLSSLYEFIKENKELFFNYNAKIIEFLYGSKMLCIERIL